MDVLVITDISRMSMLFEQLTREHQGLVVVNEINRGLEEIEKQQPSVVVIQNHLAGLSADILLKHLKSKLTVPAVRFVLISSSTTLDQALASRFEMVLDPSLRDDQLLQSVQRLFRPLQTVQADDKLTRPVTAGPSQAVVQKLMLPELSGEASQPEHNTTPQSQQPLQATTADQEHEQKPLPISYAVPSRAGHAIISDFSKQLDTQAGEHEQLPDAFSRSAQEPDIHGINHDPHPVTDQEESRRPWFRRTDVLLGIVTVAVVIGVSLLQDRASRSPAGEPKLPKAATNPASVKPVTKPPVMAAAPASPAASAAPATPAAPSTGTFTSHGAGRPRTLPAFIPKEGRQPGYAKEHPGWDHYRGQTAEYRVFRAKDSTIKAIQVLDLSGAGIQESFYTSMLKELAGSTTMRPTSSEIKEGYEIRHGEVGGLKLVQYRDAQGGRMRGIVVTWP